MGIKITNGGFITTIQDYGREGYQEFGVSVSGAMDRRSMTLANLLVGNDDHEAVIEVTMMGPMIQFTQDNIIAVTGGQLGAKLNGTDLSTYRAVLAKAGDTLSFVGMKTGARAYIAFAGGLDVPVIMGSKSTNMKSKVGGFEGRKLAAGDEISFAAPKTSLTNLSGRFITPDDFSATENTLRVLMGPQDDYFMEKGISTFLSGTYTVTNESDRMGCRMEGETIEHKEGGDIITDGIAFGAVQVPSHGQPIVMLADRQTTGGYTKIANVISVDLPRIAQCRPGYQFKFQKVTVEEAQRLYLEQLEEFKKIREKLDTQEAAPSPAPVAATEVSTEALALALVPILAPALEQAAPATGKTYYKAPKRYRIVIDGVAFEVECSEECKGLR